MGDLHYRELDLAELLRIATKNRIAPGELDDPDRAARIATLVAQLPADLLWPVEQLLRALVAAQDRPPYGTEDYDTWAATVGCGLAGVASTTERLLAGAIGEEVRDRA